MRGRVRLRPRHAGGVVCYPLDRLYQEVAYVAYHFHWSKDTIESLPHKERHRWIEEISAINGRINESSGGFGFADQPAAAEPTGPSFSQAEMQAHAGSGNVVVNELSWEEIMEGVE